MKLLVAVDDSDPSKRAVAYAIKRMQDCAAAPGPLHLLNVQSPLTGRAGRFIDPAAAKDYHRDEGLKTLAAARALLDAASIAYALHVDVGAPADVVERYVRELGVDELVMGTRGHGDLADMLLGSTSEAVLRTTSIPVVLVR